MEQNSKNDTQTQKKNRKWLVYVLLRSEKISK